MEDKTKCGYLIRRLDYNRALARNLLPDGSVVMVASSEEVLVVFTDEEAKAYGARYPLKPCMNPMDVEEEDTKVKPLPLP